MQFTHLNEPTRLARVEEQAPVVVLHWDDPSGKHRKKTFRTRSSHDALHAARMAALRFLFAQGFVLREPGTGPIRWLCRSDERFPHGHPFAVGNDGVWLGDTGAIQRVTPETCAIAEWPVGDLVMPRSIDVGGGTTFAVLDLATGSLGSDAPFLEPTRDRLAYGIVAIQDGSLRGLSEIPHTPDSDIFDGVSAAGDGRFLGPAPEGAGLYVDGALTETWPVKRSKFHAPKAAISPNGEWIALLVEDGAVRIEGLRPRTIPANFTQLLSLSIDDSGVAWAGALGAEFWGTYRLEDDAERVCEAIDATPPADGESLVIAQHGRVTQQALNGALVRSGDLPWLGMAKTGRARFVDADTVIVRTDAHTLAEIDLRAL